MTKRLRSVLLLLAVGTLAVLVFAFHPQAEEVEHGELPPVSESDLQMYIKVYTAMQDNHDLTIEDAIKPYTGSIEDFRQIERRIQGEPRLVERVRQALLDHVKEHSIFAQSLTTPTPVETPDTPKEQKPRKGHAEKSNHQ